MTSQQQDRPPSLNGQPTPSSKLTSLGEQVNAAERKRQIGFDLSQTIALEIVKMRDSMETDDPRTAEKLQQVETALIEAVVLAMARALEGTFERPI